MALKGPQVALLTEHRPIIHALYKPSDPHLPQQQKHISAVAESITSFHNHCQNKLVADFLSLQYLLHHSWISFSLNVDA